MPAAKKPTPKYCAACGHALDILEARGYDINTGEGGRSKYLACRTAIVWGNAEHTKWSAEALEAGGYDVPAQLLS